MYIPRLLALALFASGASFGTGLALPPILPSQFGPQSQSQTFIVKLKPDHSYESHFSTITKAQVLGRSKPGRTTHFDSRVFKGYAIELSDQTIVESLSRMDSVEYVEPDVIMSVASLAAQENAPWGLQAITRSVSPNSTMLRKTLTPDYKLRLRFLPPKDLLQPWITYTK